MKTAIVCDWLVSPGGAERVLKHLLDCYPDADLYAVIDFFNEQHRNEFANGKKAQTTFIQRLPFAKRHYRHYLPFMPRAIEKLDLSAYDLILSSSHAVAKGVRTHAKQCHISYVHSPMRYAWDLQTQYLTAAGLNTGLKSFLVKKLLTNLRNWDLKNTPNINHFIANSNFIAQRIKNNYQRDAFVIYPPVDISGFNPHRPKEDFYLTASRLVSYKKVDLIVETFAQMPDKKLIVIGDGPEMKKLKSLSAPNIQLLGYQSTALLRDYLERAQAFVFAAEEDFGITPVEAQAAGTPVIAFGKGGCLETINDLQSSLPTGLFFSEQTVASLKDAIDLFEKHKTDISPNNCVINANRFSAEIFKEKFKKLIKEKYEEHSGCVSV